MYGKTFESQYDGSMIGAGCNVFAVWNYILAKHRRGVIEINPKLLGFILGGSESEIQSALDFLQRPDLKSRSKAQDGRRLVKEGEFQYFVVNWEIYDKIRSEEDRRGYNASKQAEYRSNKRKKTRKAGQLPGEAINDKLLRDGHSPDEMDDHATSSLPPALQ